MSFIALLLMMCWDEEYDLKLLFVEICESNRNRILSTKSY